jgi:hypothetical protein
MIVSHAQEQAKEQAQRQGIISAGFEGRLGLQSKPEE